MNYLKTSIAVTASAFLVACATAPEYAEVEEQVRVEQTKKFVPYEEEVDTVEARILEIPKKLLPKIEELKKVVAGIPPNVVDAEDGKNPCDTSVCVSVELATGKKSSKVVSKYEKTLAPVLYCNYYSGSSGMTDDVRVLLPSSTRCESGSDDIPLFKVTSYLPPKEVAYIEKVSPTKVELQTIPYSDFLLGHGYSTSQYYVNISNKYGVSPNTKEGRQLLMLLATYDYYKDNSRTIATNIVFSSREEKIVKAAKSAHEKEVKAAEATNKKVETLLNVVDRVTQWGPVTRAMSK